MAAAEDYSVFIHESITFSKQPSSPEALSDPHLEELTIKADIGNTKLIISNIYIPSASSCSNGYQSSMEHLLTTPDTLILGDFNAHNPSWYSDQPIQVDDSINGYNFGIAPREFRKTQNRVRQMSHLHQLPSSPHAPGSSCQCLAQTIYQSSFDYR